MSSRRFRLPEPKVVPLEARDRVLILGKTGTGKSNAAKALMARESARWRIVAWDPDDECSQHGTQRDRHTLGPLRHRLTWDAFLEEGETLLDSPRCSLSIVPEDDDVEEWAAQLAELVGILQGTGNVLLVLEEVGTYARAAERTLNLLATRSRKWGVPVVMVAQRATQIPLTCRSQATQVECFRQTQPADLDALAETYGKEFAARVPRLPDGESVLWRDIEGDPTP